MCLNTAADVKTVLEYLALELMDSLGKLHFSRLGKLRVQTGAHLLLPLLLVLVLRREGVFSELNSYLKEVKWPVFLVEASILTTWKCPCDYSSFSLASYLYIVCISMHLSIHPPCLLIICVCIYIHSFIHPSIQWVSILPLSFIILSITINILLFICSYAIYSFILLSI